MKKVLLLFTTLLFVLVLFSCYDSSSDNDGFSIFNKRYVTFVIDGKEETKSFLSSEKIEYPEVPKKDNYVFAGWYYDEAGTEPAYLGSSNLPSVKLYAIYTLDTEKVLDEVFSTYIKAAVGITVDYSSNVGFITTEKKKVVGSGVIFEEDLYYYYLLSNYHVIEQIEDFQRKSIFVTDCYGDEHRATLIKCEPKFDLAVMRIEKEETELGVVPIADKAHSVGDDVIAIGQPGGVDNTVSFGNITKFETLPEDDEVNLDFRVIWHDAHVDHGSSGGALLNSDFEIIGINYAIATSPESSEFICGFAVDAQKIKEFLNK